MTELPEAEIVGSWIRRNPHTGAIISEIPHAARTADGVWSFEITEGGTCWEIWHQPSAKALLVFTAVDIAGTLQGCLEAVASGDADRALAELLSRYDAEHAVNGCLPGCRALYTGTHNDVPVEQEEAA